MQPVARTYPHQTVLWHIAGRFVLIALGCRAADVHKAETCAAIALASCLEYGLKTGEGIVLAYTADLLERDAFRFARCDSDSPNGRP